MYRYSGSELTVQNTLYIRGYFLQVFNNRSCCLYNIYSISAKNSTRNYEFHYVSYELYVLGFLYDNYINNRDEIR